MAGPNAILAPLLFTEFPGADLKVSCDFSLRKSQFLAARPQTPAYRNIHRLCHITYSVIAGEKLALSKGCFREMQPIEQKTLDFIAEIDRVEYDALFDGLIFRCAIASSNAFQGKVEKCREPMLRH